MPTPPPAPYVPAKKIEVGKIFNGMQFRVTLETTHGATATIERNDPASFTADLTVKVKVPRPHRSLADLAKLNERLPALIPGLAPMLETARISPVFDELYRLKCANLQRNLRHLDAMLSRHNFFDCETILELQHPETKRRALLIQSDMDTDTDGSDPDRVPEIDGASATFQPMTSYRWEKKTATVNSFLPPREARLKQYDIEYAAPAIAPERKQELKGIRERLRAEIADLKRFGFLVASVDPYIVLPGFMFTKSKGGAFTPAIGDYCVVIHGGTLYPALIGDAGPSLKIGEASLRLAKQIFPKASGELRAENDLKVTYLVFPHSGDRPWETPDLAKWRARCEKLLEEIGGNGGDLFTWEEKLSVE